ncbi:MAG: ATP-grasp domain-containing protein [Alphaproteobacteria bacterium]|nr:ATP-grasp domain-containing protein [Alphaproteobacteria bacterium]
MSQAEKTDPSFFSRCADAGQDYPLVIKGIFCDAFVVHSPEEGLTRFHQLVAQWGYPVLIQPFIEGQEYNLVAVGDGKGNMIGPVSMSKRALTEKGKAWAGISTLDPDLHEFSTKLCTELQWRGPMEIEVIRDNKGTIHLIEINPRFPAWVYLTHGVGRNLPIVLLQLMAGECDFDLRPASAGTLFIRYAQELIIDLAALEEITMHGQSLAKFNDEDPSKQRAYL